MDALTALQKRVSVPRLGGTAPSRAIRDEIFKAALRAPDHAQLKPWRFLEIEGDALNDLGALFVDALLAKKSVNDDEVTARQVVKTRGKPLRAPLIVVVIASPVDHAKVPEVEQILSAGCAAQNMLVASHALSVGVVWRTGSMAYDPIVKQGLGLADTEHIVGYLYMGEPDGRVREAPDVAVEEFFRPWSMKS